MRAVTEININYGVRVGSRKENEKLFYLNYILKTLMIDLLQSLLYQGMKTHKKV